MTTNNGSFSNWELEKMGEALRPLLSLTGMVGYTAARNMRLIIDSIGEYVQAKEGLLRKYGTDSGDGSGSYTIKIGDEHFDEFMGEFAEIASVRHEISFHTLPAERLSDLATGQQLLDCWFMVDEG